MNHRGRSRKIKAVVIDLLGSDNGFFVIEVTTASYYVFHLFMRAAWAAASLAIGTRNGEQET